jgi:hypothetical protein
VFHVYDLFYCQALDIMNTYNGGYSSFIIYKRNWVFDGMLAYRIHWELAANRYIEYQLYGIRLYAKITYPLRADLNYYSDI